MFLDTKKPRHLVNGETFNFRPHKFGGLRLGCLCKVCTLENLLEGYFVIKELEACRAFLDKLCFESHHVLCHTFATRYLEANPDDLRGLAAILGHASLNTVMIYTEPTTEVLATRMEKADATKLG